MMPLKPWPRPPRPVRPDGPGPTLAIVPPPPPVPFRACGICGGNSFESALANRCTCADQLPIPDGKVIVKVAKLPMARVRTSWWRRLLAWFTASDVVVFCSSCKQCLRGRNDTEIQHHRVVCEWVTELQRSLEPGYPDDRGARLDAICEQLNARMRQSGMSLAEAARTLDELNVTQYAGVLEHGDAHGATMRRVMRLRRPSSVDLRSNKPSWARDVPTPTPPQERLE